MLIYFFYTKIHKSGRKFYALYYIYEEVFNIKDLIPLKVASKKLGISYKTLYKWVKNNEVSYTKVGNRYYMTTEQLNSLVFVFTKDYTRATK